MATSTPDNSLQQQQAAQQAAQARSAQKMGKTEQQAPSVQFSQVIQAQQAAKNPTTISLMQKNPVAGASVVKAAVSASTGGKTNSKVAAASANTASATTSTATGTSANSVDGISSSGSTSSSQQLLNATAQLQELNQDFNLQYLNLQENQQAESRQYTALSNVSKTKSDTAKNSLTNVK